MKKLLLSLALLLMTSPVFAVDVLTTNDMQRMGNDQIVVTWTATCASGAASATFSQGLQSALNNYMLFYICAKESSNITDTSIDVTIKTVGGFDVLGGSFTSQNISSAEVCISEIWPAIEGPTVAVANATTTDSLIVRMTFVK